MRKVYITRGKIDNEDRILIRFYYDKEIIAVIKTIFGIKWCPDKYLWHIKDTEGFMKVLLGCLDELWDVEYTIAQIGNFPEPPELSTSTSPPLIKELPPLPVTEIKRVEEFVNWMRFRRYSESTIRTYSQMVSFFLRFIAPKGSGEEVGDDVQRFVNEYILPRNLSESFQNQLVNGVKLFFREIIKQELTVEQVKRPRREHRLPNVLSKKEVKQILEALINNKHRTMLSLIYACGLRRGELLNLKPTDIDSQREVLIIRQAKGKKDRIVPLPVSMIKMLREYFKLYKPKVWLFEGVKKGTPYDERSLQQVLKRALRMAGIRKPVTLHWLRHCYATHLHEAGTDILFIQQLLGHKNTKTTQIYTHVSKKSIEKIRSPFEDL
jgi:integrase/recombinase XerD